MDFPVQLSTKYLELAKLLNVRPEDIDEYFVRGTGPGGQKINKTNNCVELHHRPTNTNVRVQAYRQRTLNREAAYKQLLLKIEEDVMGIKSERAQKAFKVRKQKNRRSRRAKEKMLEEKHHHAHIKNMRKHNHLL